MITIEKRRKKSMVMRGQPLLRRQVTSPFSVHDGLKKRSGDQKRVI